MRVVNLIAALLAAGLLTSCSHSWDGKRLPPPDLGHLPDDFFHITPYVYGIGPLRAVSGQQVQFVVDHMATPEATMVWDFDSGCEPGSSTDPSPVVTALAPGRYRVTVRVTNYRGTALYGDELTILAP